MLLCSSEPSHRTDKSCARNECSSTESYAYDMQYHARNVCALTCRQEPEVQILSMLTVRSQLKGSIRLSGNAHRRGEAEGQDERCWRQAEDSLQECVGPRSRELVLGNFCSACCGLFFAPVRPKISDQGDGTPNERHRNNDSQGT
eukprot:4472815-Prymnesium_polylepis.3